MKKPVLLSNGKTAEYCGGLITHKLHGLDVFGHGGADAAYRGEIICIPEKELEIVLTGRNPDEKLVELADYVSEIKKVKHPFDQGIYARKGIEY